MENVHLIWQKIWGSYFSTPKKPNCMVNRVFFSFENIAPQMDHKHSSSEMRLYDSFSFLLHWKCAWSAFSPCNVPTSTVQRTVEDRSILTWAKKPFPFLFMPLPSTPLVSPLLAPPPPIFTFIPTHDYIFLALERQLSLAISCTAEGNRVCE